MEVVLRDKGRRAGGNQKAHMKTSLTVVLVVDVQQGLFQSDPPPLDAAGTIARINEVLHRARQAGAPVLFIQHDGGEEENVVPGTPGWQLHPDLRAEPDDPRVRKQTGDAFHGTGLEARLRGLGARRLVLMGFASDFCIEATLRSAVRLGFEVTVVADAHTTTDSPHVEAGKIREHQNYVWENSPMPAAVRVIAARDLRFGPA